MPITIRTEPFTESERRQLAYDLRCLRPSGSLIAIGIIVPILGLLPIVLAKVGSLAPSVTLAWAFGMSVVFAGILAWNSRMLQRRRLLRTSAENVEMALLDGQALVVEIRSDRAVVIPRADDAADECVLLRVHPGSFLLLEDSRAVLGLLRREDFPAELTIRGFRSTTLGGAIHPLAATGAGAAIPYGEPLAENCFEKVLAAHDGGLRAGEAFPMIPASLVE